MEEGKEEKPLTREDVLKMIEEHGIPRGLNLSGRDLSGIEFFGTDDLHGIILAGANLQRAKLWEVNLREADLRYAMMQEADLRYANIEDANLLEANLQNAFLPGANLDNTNLRGANLQDADLTGANLQHAFLSGANLQDAGLGSDKLQEAVLRHANLHKTFLYRANLQEADLRYSDLQEADLTGAKVNLARLEGVKLSSTTRLEHVDWGPDYLVGEEISRNFGAAEMVYRSLEKWHEATGIRDLAGEFAYRKQRAKRKALGVAWRHKFREALK